jgi:hypothetical protein
MQWVSLAILVIVQLLFVFVLGVRCFRVHARENPTTVHEPAERETTSATSLVDLPAHAPLSREVVDAFGPWDTLEPLTFPEPPESTEPRC